MPALDSPSSQQMPRFAHMKPTPVCSAFRCRYLTNARTHPQQLVPCVSEPCSAARASAVQSHRCSASTG
eukprot:4637005-Pleurochrysis_carterae.AAC.2